ncbi:MAG: hypothetical protein P4L92_22955 [Rudaea sp.]|nr:hypothetical protein [Rudaea sp.]
MSLYLFDEFVKKAKPHAAFMDEHPPGTPAPYAGIYRCKDCNFEIGIAKGHILPSDHHHGRVSAVRWILVVEARHVA